MSANFEAPQIGQFAQNVGAPDCISSVSLTFRDLASFPCHFCLSFRAILFGHVRPPISLKSLVSKRHTLPRALLVDVVSEQTTTQRQLTALLMSDGTVFLGDHSRPLPAEAGYPDPGPGPGPGESKEVAQTGTRCYCSRLPMA